MSRTISQINPHDIIADWELPRMPLQKDHWLLELMALFPGNSFQLHWNSSKLRSLIEILKYQTFIRGEARVIIASLWLPYELRMTEMLSSGRETVTLFCSVHWGDSNTTIKLTRRTPLLNSWFKYMDHFFNPSRPQKYWRISYRPRNTTKHRLLTSIRTFYYYMRYTTRAVVFQLNLKY